MIPRFARPYAKAFLESSGDLDAALEARRELGRFAEAMELVPALSAMSRNPSIPAEVKSRVVEEVAEALEIGSAARRLIGLMLANYRLASLSGVLEALDELLDRARGIVTAEVTTAEELDDGQRQRLRAVLESTLGQEVQLRFAVDRALLAGFVALVGSERYDVSLEGQLQRMTEQLAGAAFAAQPS